MDNKQAKQLAEYLDRGQEMLVKMDDASLDLELVELAELAQAIQSAQHPKPDPDWKHNARIRLLNRAVVQTPAASLAAHKTQGQVWSLRLARMLSSMAIVFLFLLAGGIFSFFTQNALPGDLLFPVKLTMEDLQIGAAPARERAILRSRFASNRLTEIQLLVVQDRYEDVDIAVQAFEGEVDAAVLALVRTDSQATYTVLLQVEKDMRTYSDTLEQLLTLVPTGTQESIERAIVASRSLTLSTD